MRELVVDGQRVFYATGGRDPQPHRPRLVMLHGAGADHTVWASQARHFAHHDWDVVAVDLPGHGASEDQPANDTIAAMAEWLDQFLIALGEGPLVIVGHSMGACIALTWTALTGRALTGTELTRASGATGNPIGLALLGAGERMPVNDALLNDTLEQPARAHAFITAFGHGRPAHFGVSQSPGMWTLGTGRALLERSDPAVLHRDFAACNQWSSHGLGEAIRCPTLVLAGAADRMTPARSGRSLAATIPGSRFEVLPAVGHMMTAEAPREVTATLDRFLKGVLAA